MKRLYRLTVSRDCQVRLLSKYHDYRVTMILDYAVSLNDLRSPPRNQLEALKGDRQGQYSIRINDQYRICLIWSQKGVREVEIIDYH